MIPLEERGKIPDVIPLFRGHTAAVLDTDWCARDTFPRFLRRPSNVFLGTPSMTV